MKNWFNKLSGSSKILHNKFILYLLVFVYIINLLTFVSDEDQTFAGFMIIIAFLTSFFSKNMIIVLFVSIVITNLIRLGMDINRQLKEGFNTSNLDELINHLSNDPAESNENGSAPSESKSEESDGIESDGSESKKVESDGFDDKLEKLIKSIELNTMFYKFNKLNFKKQLDESKKKIEFTLTQIDNIMNTQQREKVKSVLDVQLKIIEYLSGISPLMSEFKTVLNNVSSS